MKNISHQDHMRLMQLSSNLPLVMVQTHEKHFMTKAELDEMGYVGAEELEDGRYLYKYPVMIAKNHYRCMKRAFLRNGVAGISKYIDRVKALPNQ